MDVRSPSVEGWVAPGYEGVAAAFASNFDDYGEVGAAFSAYVRTEQVVRLWGGVADPASRRPWSADTRCIIFSGTKALSATCVLMLVERNLVELDAPVARYWPEFAAGGKGSVTIADVLTHQARLPAITTPVAEEAVLDPTAMASMLAAQPQETDPRAAFAYHAITFGWLCGEIVRRVDGRAIDTFFADEIAAPRALDVAMRLEADDRGPLRAQIVLHPMAGRSLAWDRALWSQDRLHARIWGNPPLLSPELVWNRPEFLATPVPAVNATASADGMAAFYQALIDPVDPVLSPELLARARATWIRRNDETVGKEMAFGLGFAVQASSKEFGPPPDAFGHTGAGGSNHGAWPTQSVAFSYLMNEIRDMEDPDPRPQRLLAALYEAVLEQDVAL